MPSKNPRIRLVDILDNIQAIEQFTAGLTFEDYVREKKTVYAVTRALEIISEASRRLPDQLKNRHPEIDWPPRLPPETSTGTSTRLSTTRSFGIPSSMIWRI